MMRYVKILCVALLALFALSEHANSAESTSSGQPGIVLQFQLMDGQEVKGWKEHSVTVAEGDSVEFEKQIDLNLQSIRQMGYPICRLAEVRSVEGDKAKKYLIEIDAGMPFKGSLIKDDGVSEGEGIITEELLFRTAKSILDSLTDNGFPFAQIEMTPQDITVDSQLTGTIRARQDIGGFMRVNAVRFGNLVRTNEEYIEKESRIRRGDVFSRSYLEKSITHLKRLKFIRSVESVRLAEVSPGLLDVLIDVDERSHNSFSVIAALDPQTQEMVGEVDVRFANLFGSGRELKTLWSNLVADRRHFELAYREPWLFGYPLALEFSLAQMTDELRATNSATGASLEWQPSFNWKCNANVAGERYHQAEDTTDTAIKTIWLGASFTWDDRDDDWNPTRGICLSTSHTTGYRNFDSDNSRVERDEIEISKVSAIRSPLYVLFSGRVEDVRGSLLHRDDLATVGGAGSVRGYVENRFEVEGATTATAEVLRRFGDSGYAGIFTDIGWLYREADVQYADEWLGAYGATLAFNTRSGTLGLDIGWNHRATFGEGRIHVKFTMSF